jgi:hypothetical protein
MTVPLVLGIAIEAERSLVLSDSLGPYDSAITLAEMTTLSNGSLARLVVAAALLLPHRERIIHEDDNVVNVPYDAPAPTAVNFHWPGAPKWP